MMKIRVMVTALVAVILIPVLTLAKDVVIIGNPSVPATALSKYDVKSIFLGNKTSWDDSSDIFFVTQIETDCHKIFLKTYIHKTPAQFSNHWKKMVFTGKGLAPPSKADDKAVINFVSQTKGAIGYVTSGTGLKNVKIINIK